MPENFNGLFYDDQTAQAEFLIIDGPELDSPERVEIDPFHKARWSPEAPMAISKLTIQPYGRAAVADPITFGSLITCGRFRRSLSTVFVASLKYTAGLILNTRHVHNVASAWYEPIAGPKEVGFQKFYYDDHTGVIEGVKWTLRTADEDSDFEVDGPGGYSTPYEFNHDGAPEDVTQVREVFPQITGDSLTNGETETPENSFYKWVFFETAGLPSAPVTRFVDAELGT